MKYNAFNTFCNTWSVFKSDTIGKAIPNVVNNGIQGIENLLIRRFIENLSSNSTDIQTMSLVCTGTSQWNWEECKTTFKITSLKYNTDTELIPATQSITIKKDYSDDANAKNDITESDVLVELLQNNKLFYEKDSTKYVFDTVDLSGMKYYMYPSKYIYKYGGKDYNRCYCLKCALNNIKYPECTQLCYYQNTSLNFNVDKNDLNNCQQPEHNNNAFRDINDDYYYYRDQIGYLDDIAKQNSKKRNPTTYSHKIGQGLCSSQEELINSWKAQ